MADYIKLANHLVTEPLHYFRVFENDLPKTKEEEAAWRAQAQRAALIALPFLSMIKPMGFAISAGMGTCRTVTHLAGGIDAARREKWRECAGEAAETALAVSALAFSLSHFTLGMIAVTSIDTGTAAVHTIQLLKAGQKRKALEELLQVLACIFYLAMMLSGSLEWILIAMLLLAAIAALQAQSELTQGRKPEAIAKLLLSFVRLFQAWGCLGLILRRNELLTLQKNIRMFERIFKGRDVVHLIKHPLADIAAQVEKRNVTLSDAEGKEYDFGSYFHGSGKGLVKGANLCFRTRVIGDSEKLELDFKVNHVFRARLQELVEQLEYSKPDDLQDILDLSGSHASGIQIEKTDFPVGSQLIGPATKIDLEGIGSIWIGASTDFHNLHDRVVIQLNADQPIYKWHELLAFFDLDDALRASTQEDMERLKMGHLYRIFCPREATPLERTEEFFDLPISELKTKIIENSPPMKEIFDFYLDKMEPREILPGKIRYAIPGFADFLHSLGAKELTTVIIEDDLSDQELFARIATILKMGVLSSETRYENGINVEGISTSEDFETGGADSVFTQMLAEHSDPNSLFYSNYGRVRLSISLEALETGTYQYLSDSYGTRRTDNIFSGYFKRLSTEEFVDTLNKVPNSYRSNEVMIKERIPPSYIQEMVIKDNDLMKEMMKYFRTKDLIQKDIGGNETIFGKPVNEFIKVG